MAYSALKPIRHENRDFFACNIFDALPFFKDDMASMEHPVFSLSTKPDMRVLHYEHNGNTLTIKPGIHGLATIYDKDILLYCTSYLRAAIADGKEPNQRIRFTAYDFFVSTNRGIDGRYYQNFKVSLERLSGTRLQTNLKTGGLTIEEGFGLIDSWRAVKEDESGRVIAAEIKLSDWIYNAILANELLTISPDYFRLRRPTDRRLYEIARKHCGNQKSFKVGLAKLHKKIGSTAPIRKLRAQLHDVEKADELPDYSLKLNNKDQVIFTNRNFENAVKIIQKPQALPLPTDAYEKARKAAPGLDIYAAQSEFNEWSAQKEPPRNRTAAFIGFCKRKAKQMGLL